MATKVVRGGHGPEPRFARMTDREILRLRLCDLAVPMARTPVARRLQILRAELDRRQIRVRPHAWFSSEWFSPDGEPGIAVPFFLAHPRLWRLEHKLMGHVEGGTYADCMKLLRHEMGHVVCSAYRLHYKPSFREHFGRFGTPYPTTYRANPLSRRFVLHLDWWYAQSHPAEDFAETFAVWLWPKSRWRTGYQGWPALKKLEYVDEVMGELRGEPPKRRFSKAIEPLRENRRLVADYYEERIAAGDREQLDFLDRDLFRIFDAGFAHRKRPPAAAFLRASRPQICKEAVRRTGHTEYTFDRILRDCVKRCRELKLRLRVSEREAREYAPKMLCRQAKNYQHHRIYL
ncbi:MAG: hypothetical protein KC416_04650 [Myxococcales bacterium]|nr:hypothetical protein [Myxococcales bacterium]